MLKNTTQAALERFADVLSWPPHLLVKYPNPKTKAIAAIGEYFAWSKGNWGVADFLAQCSEAEIPQWLRESCAKLKALCDPPPVAAEDLPTTAKKLPDDVAALLG